MSDEIIKRENSLLEQVNRNLARGSSSLAAKLNQSKRALLLDTSGSMITKVNLEKSRFDILLDVLKQFEGERQFTFNTDCYERTKFATHVILKPTGSTNLAGAFSYVKEKGIEEVVLVTDGEPDNPITALEEAKDLKLHVIFCGDENMMPEFLKTLMRNNMGTVIDASKAISSPEAVKFLAGKIKALLGEGK